jgi:glycosyltransferase involved in cell wall biosynthesis
MLASEIEISVVVPTRQRPELLARCLDALAAQTMAPARFEIIVVNDGPSEPTRTLVERFAAQSDRLARYLGTGGGAGPAAARNLGWRQARGHTIAFTDDDCLPEPGWLEAGLAALAAGADGVSGRIVMPLPGRPTDYEQNAAGLSSATFVTANCFYRRAALELAGGFDERFRIAWREDSDLYFSLLRRGCTLVEAPGAVVVHPIRPARWGVSIGQQRKNIYNALLYKKHPEHYHRIAAVTPWRYYRILAAMLVGIGGLLLRRRALAVAGWLAWGALTMRFCALRLRSSSRAPSHVTEMALTSAVIPPLAIFWRVVGSLRYRVWFL